MIVSLSASPSWTYDSPRVIAPFAASAGLSKSAVQAAVRHLARRSLVAAARRHATDPPSYEVHEPCEARRRVELIPRAPAASRA